MTDYRKGYDDGYAKGYEACKEELASKPDTLFSLLPQMGENLQKMIEHSKGQISKEYQEMLAKSMRGEVSHQDLLAFINEQNKKK